jgi:hypothetical protein
MAPKILDTSERIDPNHGPGWQAKLSIRLGQAFFKVSKHTLAKRLLVIMLGTLNVPGTYAQILRR